MCRDSHATRPDAVGGYPRCFKLSLERSTLIKCHQRERCLPFRNPLEKLDKLSLTPAVAERAGKKQPLHGSDRRFVKTRVSHCSDHEAGADLAFELLRSHNSRMSNGQT
jgi:hypothetical protein